MRETRKSMSHFIRKCGITPAYAGNTVIRLLFSIGSWDHPRVCGKHVRRRRHDHNPPGSPPRMRETPMNSQAACELIGITPAYAGNTIFSTQGADWGEDHPRVCGKHM